jgi:hypothetical protein
VLADLLLLVGLVSSSPGGLDSVEPRWTSQIVATMKRVNCRYSDCQFSMTSTMNADEVTYRPSETVGSWCESCWSLKSLWPTRA